MNSSGASWVTTALGERGGAHALAPLWRCVCGRVGRGRPTRDLSEGKVVGPGHARTLPQALGYTAVYLDDLGAQPVALDRSVDALRRWPNRWMWSSIGRCIIAGRSIQPSMPLRSRT